MEISMTEREPKLGWKTLPLSDDLVASHLATQAECFGTVMIDFGSRLGSRHHLKLHKDRGGYYVRTGRRGSCKEYLGRCKVTYFDGKADLFSYTFASVDAFEADQLRRFDAAHGITA